MSTTLVPVLSKNWGTDRSWTLDAYRQQGGYQALAKALTMEPGDLVNVVKDSGLRGRGGAGFPTGLKWSFLPPNDGGPRYLVVNADESEPGACKDIPLMMANPHALIEGMAITSYAIGGHHAYIYLRGEVVHVYRRLLAAVAEAREAGLIGEGLGPNKDYTIVIVPHAGAGAYICGEETALLDSLEGRRGQPRLRPPFPAVAGLYASPTVVNNVESIASVPAIIANGAAWFSSMGTEKSKGHGIFSLSGHVANPGQFEAPMGITLRQLIELAGGMRNGHELKFFTPGGSSTQILTKDALDMPLDFEAVAAAGSLLGTRALQIFDETTSVVRTTLRWIEFYKHESCGKCTPCREGNWWLVQMLKKFEAGQAQEGDIEELRSLAKMIQNSSLCGLGKTAPNPVLSTLANFEDEYREHIFDKKCRTGSCRSLTTYVIDPAICKGCTKCARNCPAGAITGELKKPHHIDTDKCIKCGTCKTGCPFGAIKEA